MIGCSNSPCSCARSRAEASPRPRANSAYPSLPSRAPSRRSSVGLGVKLLVADHPAGLRHRRRRSAARAGSRRPCSRSTTAESAARGADRLSGVLRVALPPEYGVRRIVPLLPAFFDRHPRLKIDLMMSDRYENLIAEGAELALRVGDIAGLELRRARKLESARRLFIAAPSYLARRGAPERLADLAQHDLIGGGPADAGRAQLGRAPERPDRRSRRLSPRVRVALGGWRRRLRRRGPRHRRRVDLDVRGGACIGSARRSADGLRARPDRRLYCLSRRPAAREQGARCSPIILSEP